MKIAVWAVALLCGILGGGELLFLAHFNTSVDPDYRKGEGIIAADAMVHDRFEGYHFMTVALQNSSYPFKNATKIRGGLNLNDPRNYLLFAAKDNLRPETGSLEFLYLPGKKQQNTTVFSVTGKNGKSLLELVSEPQSNRISLRKGTESLLSASVDLRSGKWIHCCITWDSSEIKLYLNGRAAASAAWNNWNAIPAAFKLHGGIGFLDELRIVDAALSEGEIAENHQKLISGQEYSVGKNPGGWAAEPVQKMRAADNHFSDEHYTGDSIVCSYTAHPPKIDGNPDDPAWKNAAELPAPVCRNGKAPLAPSSIKMLYDDTALYFSCRFTEPQMKQLRAAFDQHDLAIFNDDCFELVLDTENRPNKTFHFCINALGSIYDTRGGEPPRFYDSLNSVAAGQRGKDGWTLEFALPYRDLVGAPVPLPGDRWGVRYGRQRKTVTEESSFPALPFGPYGARAGLARLCFAGSSDSGGPLEIEMKQNKFSPGFQNVKLHAANRSQKNIRLRCRILCPGTNGVERTVELAAGKTAEIALPLEVTELEWENLPVVVEVDSRPVWRSLLHADYSPAPAKRRIDEVENLLRHEAAVSAKESPEVAAALNKKAEQLVEVQNIFQQKLRMAIAQKRVVIPEIVRNHTELLNGFVHWTEERKLIAWEVSPWQYGSPDEMPVSAARCHLKFRQGGNSWGMRGLCLAGGVLGNGGDFRIAVGDFYNGDGIRVDKSKITVFQMPFVRDPLDRLRSDVLIDAAGNFFSLLPGVTRRFTVAFHSENVLPGVYTGELTVKPVDVRSSDRRSWVKIPVSLEVLPFKLPDTRNWPLDAFIWHGGTTSCSDEMPMIELMDKHHINHISTDRYRYDIGKPLHGHFRNPVPPLGDKYPVGGYFHRENLAANDPFLKSAQARGMKLFFAWNICTNYRWVQQMEKHLLDLGFTHDDFLFSGFSDEFGSKEFRQFKKFHEAVKRTSPAVRWTTTITAVPPPSGCTWEEFDQMAEYITDPNWINANVWPTDTPRAAEVNAFHLRHPKLRRWIYRCAQPYDLPEASYFRHSTLNARLTGASGVAFWVLAGNGGKKVRRNGHSVPIDPDNFFDVFDPDGQSMNGLAYGSERRIALPSRRFMAWVAGLEDYALIDLLAGRKPDSPLISERRLRELIASGSMELTEKWRNELYAELTRTLGVFTVERDWGHVTLRSAFDGQWQLEQHLDFGANGQYDFSRVFLQSPTRRIQIASNGDESAPWKLNHEYIGGNHGECGLRLFFRNAHNLTEADLGKRFIDGNGTAFYLLKVENPTRLWVLSENLGKTASQWKLEGKIAGNVLSGDDGRKLTGFKADSIQIRPALRIKSQQLSVDGRTMKTAEVTPAKIFTIEEHYEILSPISLLEAVKTHPGQLLDWADPMVKPVMELVITYTCVGGNQWRIDTRAKALADVKLDYAGFVQTARLTGKEYPDLTLRIPGMKKMTLKGRELDFDRGIDYRAKLPDTVYLSRELAAKQGEYPSRFIQTLSGGGLPDVVYTIGYEPVGDASPAVRWRNASIGGFLYHPSWKIYPWAVSSRILSAGDTFHCVGVREYSGKKESAQ